MSSSIQPYEHSLSYHKFINTCKILLKLCVQKTLNTYKIIKLIFKLQTSFSMCSTQQRQKSNICTYEISCQCAWYVYVHEYYSEMQVFSQQSLLEFPKAHHRHLQGDHLNFAPVYFQLDRKIQNIRINKFVLFIP